MLNSNLKPPRPPKLGHKKSRTGCQRCRARRVKCNEVHPICGCCERYQTECIYDRGYGSRQESTSIADSGPNKTWKASDTGNSSIKSISSTGTGVPEIPASSPRHLLELRLLHQFITKTAYKLSTEGALNQTMTKEEINNWTEVFVNQALHNDTALYALYFISALHLAKSEPDNQEIIDANRAYLDIAIRKHYKDVTDLSVANADLVCMTSTLVRCSAFASLQERKLEPYSSPTQWLQLIRTAGQTMKTALQLIVDDDSFQSVRLYKRTKSWSNWETWFDRKNREGLLHLLRSSLVPNELWNSEIQEAYDAALSLIGSVQIAITNLEKPSDILRRLLILPMCFNKRFIDLVATQQPRALVILAHYFALLSKFRHAWWIGDSGRREIKGIQSVLSDEWSDLMRWPLMYIQEDEGQR